MLQSSATWSGELKGCFAIGSSVSEIVLIKKVLLLIDQFALKIHFLCFKYDFKTIFVGTLILG